MDINQIRAFRSDFRVLEREISLDVFRQSECCGVTLAQCHLLLEVEKTPGASLGDLSARLAVDPSTLSRTAENLRKKGQIACPRDESDRRSIRLFLTESGKKATDAINSVCDREYGELLEGLSDESASKVGEGISILASLLEAGRRKRESAIGGSTATCRAVPSGMDEDARASRA
jgi:DNA-binding MarR family transcriptional regulator